MRNPKSLLRFAVWTLVLAGMMGCSVPVLAEEELSELSEPSAVQESSIEEVSEPPLESSDSSMEEEPSYEEVSQPSEEEESFADTEPSYEPEWEPSYEEESSTVEEEDPFPWAREPEESYSYYDSSQMEYSEEESIVSYIEETVSDEEPTESYQEEEESSEPSVTFQETSVDNSELTQKDWEKLKDHLNSEMKLHNHDSKSTDTAVRDIKDNDAAGNDAVAYLIWGLILIGLGVAVIVFVITYTMHVKRSTETSAAKKSE